ncbi:hypothetical protein ACO0K9_20050 [Undibacterium sp. Ji50W]|uniref:hypothetical protein n=1 Tax=Undibacterium sp. Ji50W TaxID=3413041 RepID=UPI003BF1CFFE
MDEIKMHALLSNPNALVLSSIENFLAENEIRYCFYLGGSEIFFTGCAKESAGIRSVAFSEEMDKFLLTLCVYDPSIVKKMVRLTWEHLEGNDVGLPVSLFQHLVTNKLA